jgi:hypothetical protein
MRQEHAESQARPAPAPLRGHATGRAVTTSASRDLAVLGEQLAVLGVPSHVTVSSEAAVLIAGRDLVTVAHGRYWWRTGRVRQGRDVMRHHAVSDPQGAARRLARQVAPAREREHPGRRAHFERRLRVIMPSCSVAACRLALAVSRGPGFSGLPRVQEPAFLSPLCRHRLVLQVRA